MKEPSCPETAMTYPCRILSISIESPFEVVSPYLVEPRNFPQWASGLASGLTPKSPEAQGHGGDNEWLAETPAGRATIRFSRANAFGVADHWVHLPDGSTVYVPLRAVANGDGSEVSLTLFQLPDMNDAKFATDIDWVQRDLAALKRVLEAACAG
jgi:hypothetical protein